MPTFKVNVSDPETGKCKNLTVSETKAQTLIGMKIGDTIDGSVVGLPRTKLKITGGSDKDGTPMIKSVHGGVRAFIILSKGTGLHPKKRGERRRKAVRGSTITDDIIQINMQIVEEIKKRAKRRKKAKVSPNKTSQRKPTKSGK
ncbi:MAG: 30S ribosomal protein S6e [Candidatus Bathyarchaeota archaeon]|nr:30S ribosomal protein S6e [Candidatus Bathyarchaeota archaeon]